MCQVVTDRTPSFFSSFTFDVGYSRLWESYNHSVVFHILPIIVFWLNLSLFYSSQFSHTLSSPQLPLSPLLEIHVSVLSLLICRLLLSLLLAIVSLISPCILAT